MRKFTIFLALMLFIGLQVANAQRTITGKVTSSDDGSGIPGATVMVKGTATGTITDIDGKFSLAIPKDKEFILVSYVGMVTQEIKLGAENIVNVVLAPSVRELEGVVVTALGIPREKKSLGYATQEVSGSDLNKVQTDNFVNSLSGRVAGVQVKTTTNMGGSTNVLLRGTKSLTGDNQALFVIDGVPVNNSVTNSVSQQQAGQGYDYGNDAADINPDDIETINVLKGSAATALYGSRAANGVIMITTKKGSGSTAGGKKGVGVTINSGVTVGFVDKSTFPEYQNQYGGGYGHYYDGPGSNWYMRYINTDGTITVNPKDATSKLTQWVTTSEDASYGAKFDGSPVYQWTAVDPQSPNYLIATPWLPAANGPVTFFENPVTFTNSVALDNASNLGSYRLAYTNYKQNGLMPNSEMIKNNISLNGTWNVNNKLTVTGFGNYSLNSATGRNSTGYNDNILGSMRQWMETNVDMKDLKNMYNLTHRNATWNYADPSDAQPIYWDNYYWTRYENYETDKRNRFIGNLGATYKITDWLNLFGRFSVDTYSELQEERRAIGSIAATFGIGTTQADGSGGRSDQGSGYLRRDIRYSEYNYDVMANFNKDISKSFNLKAVLGMNIRRTNYDRLISSTSGGLSIPELYSLQNSIGPLPLPKELASKVGVEGIYASASLGYKNFLYLDATIRRDHASTLPKANSSYYYPSVAGSFVFSNVIPEAKWLSFGKVRLNYAQVGNSPGFDQLVDNYVINTPFNASSSTVPTIKKNPDLKPENTKSIEGGLEMYFLGKRLGFDLALYKTNTINQILPLPVSSATGYYTEIINAGEIQNQGIELAIHGNPCKNKNFKWDVTLNWAMNRNKVLSLQEGVNNLQLGSFQGGVTLNAKVGQPYGVLYGTDFVYNSGQKVVKSNGAYQITTKSDNVIGNMNPDWTGGLLNNLTYKNWSFAFLIDVQKGGDIFSLDMYYGLATGLYKETAYTNDLGNPVRDLIVWADPADHSKGYASTSGGFINPGVNVAANGTVTPNKTRLAASNYGAFGYARLPNKAFVYDASYVKLRQVSLSYSLPSAILKKCFITGVTFTAVASNVWIIFKNLPYADPESGLGAGNLQGYTTGSLPSTRDFSFNVKLTF